MVCDFPSILRPPTPAEIYSRFALVLTHDSMGWGGVFTLSPGRMVMVLVIARG